MRLLDHCQKCHPCDWDCCCAKVGFRLCIDDPLDTNENAPDCYPQWCHAIADVRYGWNAPPDCIKARMENPASPLTYKIYIDCQGEPIRTHVAGPGALECNDSGVEPIAREEWVGDCGVAELCNNCLPEFCLRIYGEGKLLATCYLCPDLCDTPRSGSSSSSSSSSGDSDASSSSDGSGSSSGSSGSSGDGGDDSSSSSSDSSISSGSSSGSSSGPPPPPPSSGSESSSSSGASSAPSSSSSSGGNPFP